MGISYWIFVVLDDSNVRSIIFLLFAGFGSIVSAMVWQWEAFKSAFRKHNTGLRWDDIDNNKILL